MNETLTPKVRQELFERAGGKCECIMVSCSHHVLRCNARLGDNWEAHRVTAGGPYALSNLKAMCPRCHRNTPSYGRN